MPKPKKTAKVCISRKEAERLGLRKPTAASRAKTWTSVARRTDDGKKFQKTLKEVQKFRSLKRGKTCSGATALVNQAVRAGENFQRTHAHEMTRDASKALTKKLKDLRKYQTSFCLFAKKELAKEQGLQGRR